MCKMGKTSILVFKIRAKVSLICKKILFVILLLTLFLPVISATNFGILGDFSFDNFKKFNNTNQKYGSIEIWDNGFFSSDTMLSKTTLVYNTDYCLLNCEAKGTTTLYYNLPLMDNLKMYDENGKVKTISTQNIQIKTGENIIQVPKYKEVCIDIVGSKNGTQTCSQIEDGTKDEVIPIYENYNGQKLNAGTYEWKIIGKKNLKENVDWTVNILGYESKEWATWNSSYEIGLTDYFNMSSNSNLINSSRDLIVHDGQITFNNTAINGQSGWFNDTASMNLSNTESSTAMDVSKNFTVSFWMNPASNGVAGVLWIKGCCSGETTYLTYKDGSNFIHSGDTVTGTTVLANTWTNIVLIYNDSGQQIYRNGNLDGFSALDIGSKTGSFAMGEAWALVNNFNGYIDEFAFWNRSLGHLEAIDLYNAGTGIFFNGSALGTITITLNNPTSNQNFSTNPIVFNCSGSSTLVNMTNLTLMIDNIVNKTIVDNQQQLNINTSYSITEGTHTYYCFGSNNNSIQTTADTRTFTLDTTPPIINITNPFGNISYHIKNTNLTINWTVTDSSIQTCILGYKNVNATVTCSANTTSINITDSINKTITFWANDSFGTVNNFNRTWDYFFLEEAEAYVISTTVGSLIRFELNVTIPSSLTFSSATLVYNNTNFAGVIINPSDNLYSVYKNLQVPTTSVQVNNTFYWTLYLSNGVNGNSTRHNQSVSTVAFDNCSANTIILYNFTIADEKTKTTLNNSFWNTSGKINLQIYTLNTTTLIQNYSFLYNATNPFVVCINNNLSSGESYTIDTQVQYGASAYSTELYHIQRDTLNKNDIGTNITLYDLDNANTQKFDIFYKNTNFLPVENALIQVQRKYVDEGIFRVVEIPKTDYDGRTNVYLELNDIIYTFVIVKNGVILATFSDVLAVCKSVTLDDCEINFNSFASHIDPENFNDLNDFSFTLNYNRTTRTISTIYTIPSSTTATVLLNATLYDLIGKTEICSDTVTGASGTLTCVIPTTFGNGSTIVKLYKNNQLIGESIINLARTPTDIYGTSIIFLSLMMMLTLIGVGISDSPIVNGFFIILGTIINIALNLYYSTGYIGAGATILWLIVVIILVMIKGARRQ